MSRPTKRIIYDLSVLRAQINSSGPQGQLVYSLRRPLTYKNIQRISRRASFTNYFDWMGDLREYSFSPIIKRIQKLSEDGKWGLATNAAALQVFGFLKGDDVLEGRLWLDRVSGHDKVFHLSFDWLRVLGVNKYERVAKSSLVVSCIEIIGHGQARIINPPRFLRDFFTYMRPKMIKVRPLENYDVLLRDLDLGDKIKDFSRAPKFLYKSSFRSTFENSNLVGNIYFSNYSKWVDATLDFFLYGKDPKFFDNLLPKGEFVTLAFKVSHLQEAMPLDRILVKMYLSEIFEKGIKLKYKVYKIIGGGSVELARVSQTIGLVRHKSRSSKVVELSPTISKLFLV